MEDALSFQIVMPFQRALLFGFLLWSLPLAATQSEWVAFSDPLFHSMADARAVAMGEATAALGRSPLEVIANPALAFSSPRGEVSLAHQSRFAGLVRLDAAAVVLKEEKGRLWTVAVLREGVSGIPNTTRALLHGTGSLDDPKERIDPSRITYFDQSDWAAVIGIANRRAGWVVGGNIRAVVHRLGSHEGYGLSFDVAALRTIASGHSFTAVVTDATTSWVLWDSGTVERVAPFIRLSGGHTVPLFAKRLTLSIAEAISIRPSGRSLDDDGNLGNWGLDFRLGGEVGLDDRLWVRMGRHPISGMTIGAGVATPIGRADYAFLPAPAGSILGTTHNLTLHLRTDTLRQWVGTLGL